MTRSRTEGCTQSLTAAKASRRIASGTPAAETACSNRSSPSASPNRKLALIMRRMVGPACTPPSRVARKIRSKLSANAGIASGTGTSLIAEAAARTILGEGSSSILAKRGSARRRITNVAANRTDGSRCFMHCLMRSSSAQPNKPMTPACCRYKSSPRFSSSIRSMEETAVGFPMRPKPRAA